MSTIQRRDACVPTTGCRARISSPAYKYLTAHPLITHSPPFYLSAQRRLRASFLRRTGVCRKIAGVQCRRVEFFEFIKFLSPTNHRDENVTAGDSDHRGNHSGRFFDLKLFSPRLVGMTRA